MMSSSPHEPAAVSSSSRGPVASLRRLLDGIGSIPFGVTLLVLIFIYSSIGSAVPPIRQGALADWLGWEPLRFEMTEMQWFSSPVFVALIAVFCLSIIIVTLRRIPLTWPRLGVWMTHTGLVVLAVSAAAYFGQKLEGDAVVYLRSAVVRIGDDPNGVRLVVRPDAAATIGQGDHRYHVAVSRIEPRYHILTGEDAGKETTAIWFDVTRPNHTENQRFTRVVLAGHPSYTEDVVVGGAEGPQRARKVTGHALLDDDLHIDLTYEPQDAFYLHDTVAVYARFDGHGPWTQLAVRGMPRYYEHVDAADSVWTDDGADVPLRPIRKRATPLGPADADVARCAVNVVGYLPYAQLERRFRPGGTELYPVLRFSLPDGKGWRSYELEALNPSRNRISFDGISFGVEFRWAMSAEERADALRPRKPRLVFERRGQGPLAEMPLADVLDRGPVGVPGSDYKVSLRSQDVLPNFPLLSPALRGREDDVAIVRVDGPEQSFTRLVYSQFEDQSTDMDEATHAPLPAPADADLVIRYVDPASEGILLLAGPTEDDGCDIVWTRADGTQTHRAARVGEAVLLSDQSAPLRIDSLIARAAPDVRPRIVPTDQRMPRQRVGDSQSLLEVEVRDGSQAQRVWLPFNQYAFEDETFAYPERFAFGSYAPRAIRLADGRILELMYSRQRRYLPSAVALDRFVLDTHPGGTRERDFISLVRFYDDGHWSEPREIRSNQPGEHAGLWFFQAEWDPEHQALTVLGVGNRKAILPMLLGVCLSIAGMAYAFYVKPAILRRRARLAIAKASEDSPPRKRAKGVRAAEPEEAYA